MWIVLVTSALTLVSYYRWLRVAQREHYEPTRLFAIEWIWIKARPVEAILLGAVVVVCLASFVLPYGALVGALLFLGGWLGPGPAWLGPVWFLLKAMLVFLVVTWVRWSFVRIRVDQILAISWKLLLPVTLLLLMATALRVAMQGPGGA